MLNRDQSRRIAAKLRAIADAGHGETWEAVAAEFRRMADQIEPPRGEKKKRRRSGKDSVII